MSVNRPSFFALLLLVFVLGGISVSLFLRREDTGGSEKFHIVTSVYPLGFIASAIGGDVATVTVMTPYGAEPHDFDPSPRDLVNLEKADLFVYNGGGLEPWIPAWKKGKPTPSPVTVEMIEALRGLGEPLLMKDNTVDPHVWLDPLMVKKEARFLRDTLTRLDSAHGDTYAQNTEMLLASLDKLDQRFLEDLGSCARRDTIVSHEAFGYLARAYDLEMISIAGISPDEEPSPQNIARIVELARARNVPFIFFETVVSSRLSDTIAREVGAKTLVLNPLESLTLADVQSGEDYLSIMMMNLSNLRKALSCQ